MKNTVKIEDWQLAWVENKMVDKQNVCLKTPADVRKLGCQTIMASVPGNFELDFMREGLLDDVYVGVNTLKTQELENLHLYYFTQFSYQKQADKDAILCFEGIDTVAEIYLDGELLGFVENMFHAHRFNINRISEGTHELLVHILPTAIYARQFDLPAMCFGMKYNHDSLQIRKASSMFGWDIMPRIVSGGLWKPICIEYLPKARLLDPFTYTKWANESAACLETCFKLKTDEDFVKDYTVTLKGKCKDSEFYKETNLFSVNMRMGVEVANPLLWWPKNYGEPNLYEMELTLYYKGVEVDKQTYRIGIRTVWLKRTSRQGDEGEFCFIVNGKKIFVLGTNWVPCDAFPSRHDEYTLRNLKLADEIGCNMIRCWGGNAYPSDVFYNYCDEHGIMVWQDFGLACGHYPDDERLCKLVKQEVKEIAIALRNHPSLTLWAGDNECDSFVVPYWQDGRKEGQAPAMLDPNLNKLTRDIILKELRNHDATRTYLPSSPYIDEVVYQLGLPAEDHRWGPRDYFKGEFYGSTNCHFASEIGYHGCPSPKSVEKFIPVENLPKKRIDEINTDPAWLVHAAGMETQVENNPYAYRLPLMISQVDRIFTAVGQDLDTFARQSQISQGEAMKFFIELFRSAKWRKTGILWWNIADGWPQISDAIVDWYGCKKIGYHYIKRSQTPLCIMCREPKNSMLTLIATNDTQEEKQVEYTVENVANGETVKTGSFTIGANGICEIGEIPEADGAFYLIKWTDGKVENCNHFTCKIGDKWDFEKYVECMKKAGFYDEFEGF